MPFRKYPAYKDSGVHWLGHIPSHWDTHRTKYVARLRSGHTPSRQHPEYWVDCTIPWFGLADVWQLRDGRQEYVSKTAEKISALGLANSAARLLPKGTVIVSRTASVGFSGIMATDMATTQDFVNWVCGDRIRPEFLLYVFRSMTHEFDRLTMGSTHQTIYMPDVGKFSTPLPPISEQDSIVAFIRRTTAKIDALVAKKERLIELLQEKRTALITHAITNGENTRTANTLDEPGSAGEPTSVRLKFLLRRMEQGWSPLAEQREASEEEWAVLKVGCVNHGVFDETEHKALSSEVTPLSELEIRDGDVLVSRANTRELLGSAAVVGRVRPRLLLCDKLYRLTVVPSRIDPKYLVLVLAAQPTRYQLEIDAVGASNSMQNITQDTIRNLLVAMPPRHIQSRIAALVDERSRTIQSLIMKAQTALDHLKELRTALISAAVTGKIDVRESTA